MWSGFYNDKTDVDSILAEAAKDNTNDKPDDNEEDNDDATVPGEGKPVDGAKPVDNKVLESDDFECCYLSADRLHLSQQYLWFFRFATKMVSQCSHIRRGVLPSAIMKLNIICRHNSMEWKSHTMVGLSSRAIR